MSEERYRIVTTRIRWMTPMAIMVDHPFGGEVSIPRSLIDEADERKLDAVFFGEPVTFRLKDWKAEELGFA